MSNMYLVTKNRQRAWGFNPDIPHEVWPTRKEANASAKKLNEKAQNYFYSVQSIKVGGSK